MDQYTIKEDVLRAHVPLVGELFGEWGAGTLGREDSLGRESGVSTGSIAVGLVGLSKRSEVGDTGTDKCSDMLLPLSLSTL